MSLVPITLENLPLVRGGAVKKLVDKHIERIIRDIIGAPDVEGDRTVIIKIKAKPILDDDKQLENVGFTFEVGDKCPSRAATLTSAVKFDRATGKQLVLFEVDDQDHPDQASLLDGLSDNNSGENNRPAA